MSKVKNLAIWRTSGRSEVSPWVRQSLTDSNSRYNLSRVSENFVVVVKRALSHSHTEVALRIGSKSCCRSHHYTPFASVHWMFSIDIGNEILSDLSHASVALYAPWIVLWFLAKSLSDCVVTNFCAEWIVITVATGDYWLTLALWFGVTITITTAVIVIRAAIKNF